MKTFWTSSFPKKSSAGNTELESMTPEEKLIPAIPQARVSSAPRRNFSFSGSNN